MTVSPAPSARAETAIASFLRGIERRGVILAQAQCGDLHRAQTAAAAASHAFQETAARLPMAGWPALYWQSLLAQPALRVVPAPNDRDELSQLSPAPRAALLLRLVAGMDQVQGAEVLRVSPEAYRHALYRALQALQERGIDENALRALRDRLQAQANASGMPTPPSRGAMPHENAVQRKPQRSKTRAPAFAMSLWLRRVVFGVLGLLVIVFIATFWKPGFLYNGTPTSHFEPLNRSAPAAVMSPVADALGGADFEMFADPDGEHIARELDLASWYAAGATAPDAGAGTPIALPESSTPETSAPDADAQDCADAASAGCASAVKDDSNAQ